MTSLQIYDIIMLFVLLPISLFLTQTAPTEIYTLSLHDALPISQQRFERAQFPDLADLIAKVFKREVILEELALHLQDRKSTRLNSSHGYISYAVFCLKKKT